MTLRRGKYAQEVQMPLTTAALARRGPKRDGAVDLGAVDLYGRPFIDRRDLAEWQLGAARLDQIDLPSAIRKHTRFDKMRGDITRDVARF